MAFGFWGFVVKFWAQEEVVTTSLVSFLRTGEGRVLHIGPSHLCHCPLSTHTLG